MLKEWKVAIYARVSTDKREQQESIPAQIQCLEEWLAKNGKEDRNYNYKLIKIYEDQGVSGSTFERDSFKQMEEDIESGKIDMVLTRDLSRFGRNYITSGYYLEDYFKVKGVRFISVLDNVDTIDDVNDIVPFKNILNEMYIKDCSRRTRDGLKQRMKRGSCILSKPPYGYNIIDVFENGVKNKKLVSANDETTEVVKKIYDLYLQGWGVGRIATHLNNKSIAPPSMRFNTFPKSKFGLWTNNTIQSILSNPKYKGVLIQGQYRKVTYKSKKVVKVPEDEWINGGEFEGIIDKDTFEKVEEEMKRRSKGYRYKGAPKHIFSTVLSCNECKGSMSYRKKYQGYKCTNSQMGGGRCTAHSIKEEYLKEIIIQDLKAFVKEYVDENELYDEIEGMLNKKSNFGDRIIEIDKELKKLDSQFERVYLDKINNVLSERNFENIACTIEKKQNNLIQFKDELLETKEKYDDKNAVYEAYKDKVDKILSFQEFDRMTVESLINKIIITEDKETKEKKIDIYYKFHS
ncbi:recombinase family protein [Oceanirhabdus sp. W0125-5]|uniref:recombinase family protein n=1 Tax=Oceanirhabdus sp. W0125-5 TaxID=2999116 RepID=UPI0022F2F1EB|nr:recombinase family protein [Oceanirhabdus sp. W0125-5]WBW98385.1 recombinase family protein [Oceanirhabdus sp. W0125-5]